MVAVRRDVGGRCIKARGLPGLSQQPGTVTEPLELGETRRRLGQKTRDLGTRAGREPTRNPRTGQRHRRAAPNCSSRWPSVAAAPGHYSKALQDAPSPWLLPLNQKKKKRGKKKGRILERKARFATTTKGGREKIETVGLKRKPRERGPSDAGLRAQAASCD